MPPRKFTSPPGLHPDAQEIIYGSTVDVGKRSELYFGTVVDEAHIIMLKERNILNVKTAFKLLKAIRTLRKNNFSALADQVPTRGWYLLYENHLRKTLGEEIGGNLHVGRSRNDLYATIFRLRLREPFKLILAGALELRQNLLKLSENYDQHILPLHTQRQPAVPSSFGHYFSGLDQSISRHVDQMFHSFLEADLCPLGAGAAAGTSFPIAPKITTRLLGFKDAKINSIDAVASYDFCIYLLSSLTGLGVTVSRLAADLQMWTTQELNFLEVDPRLIGGSSMLPQKRNPYILEHIKAKASDLLGFFTTCAGAMQRDQFSNSIEVKEAAAKVWPALETARDMLSLTNLTLKHISPKKNCLSQNTTYEFIFSLPLAEGLVRKTGCSIRTAHSRIEEIAYLALNSNRSFLELAQEKLSIELKGRIKDCIDPLLVINGLKYGGGPGKKQVRSVIRSGKRSLSKHKAQLTAMANRWNRAWSKRDHSASSILTKAGF